MSIEHHEQCPLTDYRDILPQSACRCRLYDPPEDRTMMYCNDCDQRKESPVINRLALQGSKMLGSYLTAICLSCAKTYPEWPRSVYARRLKEGVL